MYDVKTQYFILEPAKCMSRTVEEMVKAAAGMIGQDTRVPGHLGEDWVIEHEHSMLIEQGLPPIKALVMVMREPVDRIRSAISYSHTPREGDIFENIDAKCREHAGHRRTYAPQTYYLSDKPIHLPKHFFSFEAIDKFAKFIGYEGRIPHNNPTSWKKKRPGDFALAEQVVAARYQADVALYKRVMAVGGHLTIPAQGYMDY